jgi:hypothetical protein
MRNIMACVERYECETKTISEISEPIKTGKNKPSDNKLGTKYPYYGTSGITGYTDEYLFDGEHILTARNGTVGNTFLVSGKIFPSDHMFVINTLKGTKLKFLFYCMNNLINFKPLITGVTIPGITKDKLCKINIFVPSLKDQEEIIKKMELEEKYIEDLVLKIKSSKENIEFIMRKYLKSNEKTNDSDDELSHTKPKKASKEEISTDESDDEPRKTKKTLKTEISTDESDDEPRKTSNVEIFTDDEPRKPKKASKAEISTDESDDEPRKTKKASKVKTSDEESSSNDEDLISKINKYEVKEITSRKK